jgi:hypothetical protein
MGQRNYNMDAELILKDAGLVDASAAATVGGQARIIDLGERGRFEGVVVVDVSAIEIASNDEQYTIVLQGSNSATIASSVEILAMMNLGALELRTGDVGDFSVDSIVGRYEIPFVNEQADRKYRYVRLYTVVSGSIATGINYSAYIGVKP